MKKLTENNFSPKRQLIVALNFLAGKSKKLGMVETSKAIEGVTVVAQKELKQ